MVQNYQEPNTGTITKSNENAYHISLLLIIKESLNGMGLGAIFNSCNYILCIKEVFEKRSKKGNGLRDEC